MTLVVKDYGMKFGAVSVDPRELSFAESSGIGTGVKTAQCLEVLSVVNLETVLEASTVAGLRAAALTLRWEEPETDFEALTEACSPFAALGDYIN